jgi:TIGR00255 family protein
MKSMTGYGYAVENDKAYRLEVEIKSYNSKFLEIVHNLYYAFSSLEAEIDERIKRVSVRGHVEVAVRLKEFETPVEVVINSEAVKAYKNAFAVLETEAGIKSEPTVSDYIAQDGIIETVKSDRLELYRDKVFALLEEALIDLEKAKVREGRSTHEDLERLGSDFKASLAVVNSKAAELESYVRNTLTERIKALEAELKLDPARYVQEVALLLVKYSINEEQKRLKAHLAEYDRLLSLDEPVGKRLDFLCQEMNREINTIASKSQMVEINLQVVVMKDSLENIREQIRNIE